MVWFNRTPAEFGHGHIPGAQNLPLFRRLHWTPLQAETLHGRPHWLMQAQLDHYPPCYDVYTGFVARSAGAPA